MLDFFALLGVSERKRLCKQIANRLELVRTAIVENGRLADGEEAAIPVAVIHTESAPGGIYDVSVSVG